MNMIFMLLKIKVTMMMMMMILHRPNPPADDATKHPVVRFRFTALLSGDDGAQYSEYDEGAGRCV